MTDGQQHGGTPKICFATVQGFHGFSIPLSVIGNICPGPCFYTSKVFIHHGETEHATWYNVLAVRLASLGCMSLAMDAQGFGQSDGARGYFETFEEVKDDFIGETIFALGHFCF